MTVLNGAADLARIQFNLYERPNDWQCTDKERFQWLQQNKVWKKDYL